MRTLLRLKRFKCFIILLLLSVFSFEPSLLMAQRGTGIGTLKSVEGPSKDLNGMYKIQIEANGNNLSLLACMGNDCSRRSGLVSHQDFFDSVFSSSDDSVSKTVYDSKEVIFKYRSTRSLSFPIVNQLFLANKIMGVITSCRKSRRRSSVRIKVLEPTNSRRKSSVRVSMDSSKVENIENCDEGASIEVTGRRTRVRRFSAKSAVIGDSNNPDSTPIPDSTKTPEVTPTIEPTNTPMATPTVIATSTMPVENTPTPRATATKVPEATPTIKPTLTPTLIPQSTNTPRPTVTPIPPTPVPPTATPRVISPTATPKPAATSTPKPTPTRVAPPNNSKEVKILPLGDSITHGSSGLKSYRVPLWQKLKGAGIKFDFVGSMNSNHGGNPSFPSGFDRDHEGHRGFKTSDIVDGLPGWLKKYKADIVLFHIGTNDLRHGREKSGPGNVSKAIDLLRGNNPNVKILLAKIIPLDRVINQLKKYNEELVSLAKKKTTSKSPVIIVDIFSGFTAKTDTVDTTHPNSKGEEKIATKWFNAIRSIL